jgi:hypothetical protein
MVIPSSSSFHKEEDKKKENNIFRNWKVLLFSGDGTYSVDSVFLFFTSKTHRK